MQPWLVDNSSAPGHPLTCGLFHPHLLHDHILHSVNVSCCAMLRFIVSYLGNRSVALAPDVPLHALRPVSINCPAPSAKYVAAAQPLTHKDPAGHTSSSSYISRPYTGSLIRGCTLTQYLEYQEVRYDAYMSELATGTRMQLWQGQAPHLHSRMPPGSVGRLVWPVSLRGAF